MVLCGDMQISAAGYIRALELETVRL